MYSSIHNHTMYSLLDGFPTPKEYLDRAKEIGLKAFAVTEHGNMYSWVYFDKIKKDYPEIKILYGVEFYECDSHEIQDPDNKYYHLVAIAKNEKGRIALNELVTESNLEHIYYKPRVTIEDFKPYADNLIVSSACLASKLSREKNYDRCIEYVNEYKNIFPYFYLEMQSHESDEQIRYNNKILQLSKDTNTPYIITTDSHAVSKEDLYYQARLVQIARDDDTLTESYEGCYLQTEKEIHAIMDRQIGYENVCTGLENTNVIADMCNIVNMPFQEPQLPTFPLPEGFADNYEYLKHLVEKGWKSRGYDKLSKEEQKVRRERIDEELGVIHQMHFDGYFLIVWDFINFARKNEIAIGCGRGSASGSLICYLLYVTDLDPIKYGLIFSRFLNIERISMPDTDTDVSNREMIINYLIDKYGAERVCQVINYSYITPVVAIKDVGKVLGYKYNEADKLSKRFDYETWEECMKNNPQIYEEYPDYEDWLNIAGKLSGRVRQVSIHAGGVGIVDTKITDYMAMKLGSDNEHVIQVDKKLIEEIGIIKFDILGVRTLGIVQEAIKEAKIDPFEININNLNFENDKASYDLLASGRTNGVFQVESAGMKDLLLRLEPQNIEELCAVVSLYRPDTMPYLEDFIKCKHNPEDIEYIHPDMKSILQDTFGQMIYQEELMEIVRVFGGRTYGGADRFRKGIGKKDVKLVKSEANKLCEEIKQNGYSKYIARTISDDLAKKGGYMFNKSHGMSYAVLCLQTAYLKKHYPVQFFKALLSDKKADFGALNKYIVDAQEFGVKVLPPSINKSDKDFAIYNNKILFGLQAIKGIGEKLVDTILEERKNGEFKGLNDFIQRVKPTTAQVVALIKAGALPTKDKKKLLLKYAKSQFTLTEYKDVVSTPTLKILKSQWGIETDDKEERLRLYNSKRSVVFYEEQKLKYKKHINKFIDKYMQDEDLWEFEALSIFVTNNPFKEIYNMIKPFDEVEDGGMAVIVGVISNIIKKKDRNKRQFAYVNLYSAFGIIEVTCWASHYAEYQSLIEKGKKVAVLCSKEDGKGYIKKIKTFGMWEKDTNF